MYLKAFYNVNGNRRLKKRKIEIRNCYYKKTPLIVAQRFDEKIIKAYIIGVSVSKDLCTLRSQLPEISAKRGSVRHRFLRWLIS
jgi:hypothetical protein